MSDKIFISIRVVKAETKDEAIEKVQDNEFDETHELCDVVIPLNELEDYLKNN